MEIKDELLTEDYYRPNKDLLAAINTALFLKRPLLLSGEPGTGKTECANFIARQLQKSFSNNFKSDKALRFNTKSVSQSTDLFYSYDAVSHFGDKEGKPKENFISLNCLGVAILQTLPVNENWNSFQNYTSDVVNDDSGRGSVVLIDEIDKAPRDFPNDLLSELEKPPFKFTIKELNGLGFMQDDASPIVVVITSNSEKGLPDAFLRRCIFHHINFPSPEVLLEIVRTNLQLESPFFANAIDLFMHLRNMNNIGKAPATSELIDWICCLEKNELLDSNLKDWKNASPEFHNKIRNTLGIIAKNRADFEIMSKELGKR
ncbi:MoxR family ATPase [Maribacter algarum]|uniref:MoxR family ATPase n=1 Tax=Maribacter algarum (ex Zhang et al. 2020) TaxID=2578118 RepID=A0A5S3PSP0_9FLAO|nr:MoxR family ATPase [Maribacter algarum]TMM58025.1 MoxR family ATPase [Maribacter algarum]